MTDITGKNLIAGEWSTGKGEALHGVNAATGEPLQPAFHAATEVDVAAACEAAWSAFVQLSAYPAEDRASFLEAIAAELEAIAAPLIARTVQESGLPEARITGELGRTTGQLRLFASEVRAGYWRGQRIDLALPDRKPLPRPDLRTRRVAIGPVAVFGASNFPLAFSVAGGDTASALAAGCTVVVKGHPAHPGASEMVGAAIARAITKAGLPAGTFSLLHGGTEVGAALVRHPRIKAVGFTGSRRGGLAIMEMAAARPEPIPVFAEMSSINPVLLFPKALAARGEAIADGLAGSLTMGAGQFCTNPGVTLVIGADGSDYESFRSRLTAAIEASTGQPMLTDGIATAYEKGLERTGQAEGVTRLGTGQSSGRCPPAAVFETDAKTFAQSPALQEENFGASGILVRCADVAEAISLLSRMEGQLTATLQMDDDDMEDAAKVVPVLERLAGRILVNGYPTGVEVCHAMVHGGPFPATSDSRTTSVGTMAMDRFLRPVCYQNFPAALLPDELLDRNPTDAMRRVNGVLKS